MRGGLKAIGALGAVGVGAIALVANISQIQEWIEDHQVLEWAISHKLLPSKDLTRLQAPIDNIFLAWRTRDLDLYMHQWDARGRRYGGIDDEFDYDRIQRDRAAQFARLARVDEQHQICHFGKAGENEIVFVKYDIVYHWTDGRTSRQRDIVERYELTYNATQDRWLILKNWDRTRSAGSSCTFAD